MKSLALILGLLVAVQALPAKGPTPLDVTIPVIEGAPVPIRPKIVGGQPAVLGQFPYQAGILINNQLDCGGSLIATDWIITAAHCVVGSTTFQVILGRIQWQGTGGESIVTTQKIVHESYNPKTSENDIALLHLPRKVTLTDNIKLVALTTAADVNNTFVGEPATLSGWGLTRDNGSLSPNLLWVEVPVITNAVCNKTYGNIRTSEICTSGAGGKGACRVCTSGAGGKGACSGDSGDPLVIIRNGGFTQIGVVTTVANKGCARGYPTIYTRVTSFRDWIQKNSGV